MLQFRKKQNYADDKKSEALPKMASTICTFRYLLLRRQATLATNETRI